MDPIKSKKKLFHTNMTSPMCLTYLVDRELFDSIAAGQSALIEIPVNTTKGSIQDVKCQCASTNYDLYIMPYATVEKGSIGVAYESKAINKVLIDRAVDHLWSKYSLPDIQRNILGGDLDKNLYVLIENKDAIPTGDIIFELVIQQLQ